MKFRNYCIVVMGNMEAVKNDIIKIAETKPRYLDAKGILIATFASVAEPSELKEFFNFNGRSFLLFDLEDGVSACHLDNEKLNLHLFGHLGEQSNNLKEMSEKLMGDLSASTNHNKAVKETITKSPKKVDYLEMSKKERELMVNSIIDKYNTIGIEKITDSDRDILKKISELE